MLNIPNLLTLFRIMLTPVIVWLYVKVGVWQSAIALLVAYLTDFLDGRIARKYNMITTLGKILDPLADKLLMASLLLCMLADGRIPKWTVIIMLAQATYLILGGSTMLLLRVPIVSSNIIGKSATAFFFLSAVCIFPGIQWEPMRVVGMVALHIALALMLCAAVSYTYNAIQAYKKTKHQ